VEELALTGKFAALVFDKCSAFPKCTAPQLSDVIHHGPTTSIRVFPLLGRTIQIPLMKEIAQALLEAGFGRAAHERMKIRRAKVSIAGKQSE
jgi:hypothetical protein